MVRFLNILLLWKTRKCSAMFIKERLSNFKQKIIFRPIQTKGKINSHFQNQGTIGCFNFKM